MPTTRLAIIVALLPSLLLLGGGCKKPKSTTILGSCDRPSTPANPGHSCTDEYDPYGKKNCSAVGGAWSDKRCDLTGAVAACKHGDTDYWYYSDTEKSPQAVAGICGTDPMILPAGGSFVPKTEAQLRADKLPGAMAQHGARARANLATLATLTKKLPAPTGKVDLQGIPAGTGPKQAGVLLVHAEDLGDLEHPKKLAYRLEETTKLGACSRLVNKRQTAADDPDELYGCAEDVVLAVVSVTTYADATGAGQTTEGKVQTQYVHRGQVAGSVLFFRLDGGGKPIGGYTFHGDSGPVLSIATWDSLKEDLRLAYVHSLDSIAGAQPTLRLDFALAK